MAVKKPEVPPGVSEPKQDKRRKESKKQVKPYEGPRCFIIPGNHDWFDGLHTFLKNICHKSWLGGWFMPQRKSYFALKLPKGWWVLVLILPSKVGKKDSVIIITHQPEWLLEWYENNESENNVSDLINNILKERCKLRIAGDIHHYMHHLAVAAKPNESDEQPPLAYPQHLLVFGCGGAYVHPTHVFSDFKKSHGVSYKLEKAYPSFRRSRKLESEIFGIFGSRTGNLISLVALYTSYWSFPCSHSVSLITSFKRIDSVSGFWWSCFGTVGNAFIYMLDRSYVSLGGASLLAIVAIAFAPYKGSWKSRVTIGIFHVSAHFTAALFLMLVLELGVETLVRHELLATSGYHSLYRWYQSAESRHFPLPFARARIERWTFGLYPACIKYLMAAFDVPELMAVTRVNICKNGMESISRVGAIMYYASVFLYFWVLSTPAVSFVFGSYLYICINWFNLHYDEAFSSLRIADYKAFTRFHIKPNGDLEVFTLAVDKVPEEWQVDPEWQRESLDPKQLSHDRKFPSKWRAAAPYQDPFDTEDY